MKKYLYVLEDGELRLVDQIGEGDVEAVADGLIRIVDLTTQKELNTLGEWIGITS